MENLIKSILLGSIILVCCSCNQNKTQINGTIDYVGNATLTIEQKPLHYKYAPVQRDTLVVADDGSFQVKISSQDTILRYLNIGDESYPLVIVPGTNLNLVISRSDFPENVQLEGYPKNWGERFDNYLKELNGLDTRIQQEVGKSKVGEENQLTQLSKQKYEIAQKHLEGTPLHEYYLRAIGEYLVFRIRSIEYKNRHFEDFDGDSARTALFKEAKAQNFFSFKSLKAQRAGIRDFTHYYARTFGIYDSVKAEFGQDLSEYDIKRLAYEELNEKRLEVLEHIDNRDALAHARMYLVAERIGEQSLETATPSYETYLDEFSDYPKYTAFLTNFYNEIKSVSPGQPAIPFSLPDIDGNIHTMEDYRGKFVLLDFWAGWCQPCLDEFSSMKDIYEDYSRDELEIIGISNELDSLVWVQDIQRLDLPWVQLYGGKGFEEETFKAYKGGGIPFYILVNPDGKIARYNDIRPSFNFRSVLDSLLSTRNNRLNK